MASITAELERLAALLEKGLLTREEFEHQKASLMASPSGTFNVPAHPSNPNKLQEAVGAYKLLETIGRGGMGMVYRGRHRTGTIARRQGGDVAIKVMHAQYGHDPNFQERFEREASLGLILDHPGIVRVHDLVVDAGTLALVMELVDGRPLSELIGKITGPIPWSRAAPMFQLLLEAAEYAHSKGVVHRDIKPENIIVTPTGQLKVLDFGIAKEMGSGATRTGTGMGTVDYMAPEQYTDAKNIDHRADIYALGMTLYEMLAGRLPWEPGAPEFTVLNKKAEGEIPSPTEFYPEIPNLVVNALHKAISVNPTHRFATATAFLGALQAQPLDQTDPAVWSSVSPIPEEPSSRQSTPKSGAPNGLLAGNQDLSQDRRAGWAKPGTKESRPDEAARDGVPISHKGRTLGVGLAILSVGVSCLCLVFATRSGALDDIPENDAEAVEYFQKACGRGNMEGCARLGVMFQEGRGVSSDDLMAVKYYTQACDGENPAGCRSLGVMYEYGWGVGEDETEAMRLYLTACNDGDLKACKYLAVMIDKGDADDRDATEEPNQKANPPSFDDEWE